MYRKVLVPLDGSIKEVEGVLDIASEMVGPEGEGILLHVIPPGGTRAAGLGINTGPQGEKQARARAKGYLKYFADGLNRSGSRWSCEVVAAKSVADAVLEFAGREEVDAIAIYTHQRRGLAKLIKGSVAEEVERRANTDVRVVFPKELAPAVRVVFPRELTAA
jgi:nucleotide-binding universal stress UspA family protein